MLRRTAATATPTTATPKAHVAGEVGALHHADHGGEDDPKDLGRERSAGRDGSGGALAGVPQHLSAARLGQGEERGVVCAGEGVLCVQERGCGV